MEGSIRPIAVCVFSRGGKILVHEVRDSEKGETFYRPVGGGIEFGERSEDAVAREVSEELGLDAGSFTLIGVVENVFDFDGSRRHEICFIYDGKFSEESVYEKDNLKLNGTKGVDRAVWVELSDFRSGKKILYPQGVIEML